MSFASGAARCDQSASLYTDAASGAVQLLVFGGRAIDPSPAVFDVAYSDLWSFDFASRTWTQLSDGKEGPGGRFAHGADLMDGRRLVVWGGLTFYGTSFYVLDSVFVFDLETRKWSEPRLEVALSRSFQSLTAIGGGGTSGGSRTLMGFGGYVIFQSPSVAFVYNDLLVLQAGHDYWQKVLPQGEGAEKGPGVRYDHRALCTTNGSTLVLYGGAYQSVDDVGSNVWTFDTTKILPSQLIRAPAEGRSQRHMTNAHRH